MKGIFLEAELLRSEAFRGLSRWGLQVYLVFLSKRVIVKQKRKESRSNRGIIANNGEITFCYSEAEKMNICRREFRNAIDELIDKGFIDLTHQGAGGRSRDKSLYHLGNRWKLWNTPAFVPTKNPRIKDTIQGRGWAAVNALKKKKSVTNLTPVKPLSSDKNDTRKGKKREFRVTELTPEKEDKIASNC